MSDYFLAIILAVIQGLTEFLPISSSAHLLFPTLIFGTNDLGLLFDVATHLGTLLAVITYFRKDLVEIFAAWCPGLKNNEQRFNEGLMLIVGTLPIVIIGLFFRDYFSARPSLDGIAYANLIFAGLLLSAFLISSKNKSYAEITLLSALVIGLFQIFALFPGASRSGMAITGALFMGLSLKSGSKFAFLLSIPTILASLILLVFDELGSITITEICLMLIGISVSAFIAFFTIKYFLKFVNHIGMVPFVIYRIILGAAILMI